MTALVGACALRRDHVLAPLFENRVVGHIGTVSYGIYLLNVPVVAACKRLVGEESTVLLFAVSTVASVAVATATYRWVERPFLGLRDRFRAASVRASASASATAQGRHDGRSDDRKAA